MPDFSLSPISTDEEVEKWLHFYNMSAPLIAVGTLASADPVSWNINYHFLDVMVLFKLKFSFSVFVDEHVENHNFYFVWWWQITQF